MLAYRTISFNASPAARSVGPLLAAATPQGIAFLRFGDSASSMSTLQKFAKKHSLNAVPAKDNSANPATKHLESLESVLAVYFDPEQQPKELSTMVPLDLLGSDSDKCVWKGLCEIPEGEAWTYGELAKHLGMCGGMAARLVGQANNRNPIPIVVPCHRVVAANHMGGYAGPPAMSNRANLLRKQELLTMEFKRRGNKEMPHTVIKLEAALKGDKSKGTKGRKAENKVEAKVAEAL